MKTDHKRIWSERAYKVPKDLIEKIYELAIRVERRLNSRIVLEVLADLFLVRGLPEHIRSDKGSEFISIALRQWLSKLSVQTLYRACQPRSSRLTLTAWRYERHKQTT